MARLTLIAVPAFFAFLMGVPVLADDRADCAGSNPDRSISGCTRIIEAGEEPSENLALAYYNRGRSYSDKGDYDRAIADYDRAIELQPSYVIAYNNRGAAYGSKGDYDRAIADYDKAIQLQPDYAVAYNNRGWVYFKKGQYDRAIADADRAIQLQPDYAYAYDTRGSTHAANGDLAKALIDYRAVVSLVPASDPLRDQVLVRITELEKKLATNPTVTPAPSPVPEEPGRRVFSVGSGVVVEVSSSEVDEQEITFITVNGDFKPGDEKSFRQAALTVGDYPLVFLKSPGGDLKAGIDIGRTIWTNEFSTVVLKDTICASACALVWLAGRPRYMAIGAQIGFHAPTRVDDPDRLADSVGSALTGSYLAELGLTTGAIAYIMEMGPDEMRWLTPDDAARLGIYTQVWDFELEPEGVVDSFGSRSSPMMDRGSGEAPSFWSEVRWLQEGRR